MRDAADHTLSTVVRRRAGRLAAAAVVALAGCSSGGGSDAAPSTTGPARSTTTLGVSPETTETTDGTGSDCPDGDAVAEVVGGPVDETMSGGGQGGTDLSWSFQGCGYDLTEGDGSVGIVRVTVDQSTVAGPDGASDFAILRTAAQDEFATGGFEPIPGLGDDAHRDGQAVVVLHGSQMFFVEVEVETEDGSDATDEERAEVAAEARAVAVEVLAVDLSVGPDRLCDPLEAAASAVRGEADRSTPLSGVIGIDEVSITTEGCSTMMADGSEVEVSVADAADWDAWVAAKRGSTFSASYEEASIGERAAFATGDGLFVDDGDRPLLVTSDDLGSEPDAEAELRVALAELVLGD